MSIWVRLPILLYFGLSSSCVNYWGEKVLWVQCSTKNMTEVDIARCEQVRFAYIGNMLAIKMGQNVNQPESQRNLTMLMAASHEGHYKIVKKLLENGASEGINMQDKCGWSALMFAAFTGFSIEVVQLLLQHGADVDLANDDGRTALFMASEKGYVEIVKILLKNNTNIMHRDMHTKSAVELGVATRARWLPPKFDASIPPKLCY